MLDPLYTIPYQNSELNIDISKFELSLGHNLILWPIFMQYFIY